MHWIKADISTTLYSRLHKNCPCPVLKKKNILVELIFRAQKTFGMPRKVWWPNISNWHEDHPSNWSLKMTIYGVPESDGKLITMRISQTYEDVRITPSNHKTFCWKCEHILSRLTVCASSRTTYVSWNFTISKTIPHRKKPRNSTLPRTEKLKAAAPWLPQNLLFFEATVPSFLSSLVLQSFFM